MKQIATLFIGLLITLMAQGQNNTLSVNLGADTSICLNNNHILKANTKGGVPPYKYVWDAWPYQIETKSDKPVSPRGTTKYIITVTDAMGVTATDDITLIVHPIPIVQGLQNAAINAGMSIFLDPNISSGTAPFKYKWTPSASVVDAYSKSTYAKPTATTNYTLYVTDVNGCIASGSSKITLKSTPIKENNGEKTVEVYPNPSTDGFFWIKNNFQALNAVEVFDLLGKRIYQETLGNTTASERISLDLSNLNKGIFLLRLRGKNNTITTQRINVM